MQGNITPANFNRIINVAQREYMSYLLGSFQQYTPGRPVARVELGQNSVVRQRLTPVIYGYTLTVDGTGGSPYPGDYLQTDAMWGIYGFSRIRFVQQDSLHSHYNSVIDRIEDNPIYLLQDTQFQFYPTTTGSAKLSYVRNPPNILWAYTLDGNNRPVYDSVNSVDPVFDDLSIMEIISRALLLIGINLQAQQVISLSQEIKNSGQ